MLAVTAVCAACHNQPGPAFTGESHLALPPEAEAAHDELLNADITRGDAARRKGFTEGFAAAFAEDAVYLRGGLPILRGDRAIRAVLAADSGATRVPSAGSPFAPKSVVIAPAALPTDMRFSALPARSQCCTSIGTSRSGGRAQWDGASPLTRKPMARHRVPSRSRPSAAEGMLADVAMSPARAPVDLLRAADVAFSRDAERLGAGEAFGRYAAPDAQIFSASGEFITGPQAISASFGPAVANSSFTWQPVHGEISRAGDLGFTVGNAVVTLERQDGAAVVRYSKYLTVWKRQQDGAWKYVVDGGNSRPSPKVFKLNP
jgi:Ketosteroid isomerase homolog